MVVIPLFACTPSPYVIFVTTFGYPLRPLPLHPKPACSQEAYESKKLASLGLFFSFKGFPRKKSHENQEALNHRAPTP